MTFKEFRALKHSALKLCLKNVRGCSVVEKVKFIKGLYKQFGHKKQVSYFLVVSLLLAGLPITQNTALPYAQLYYCNSDTISVSGSVSNVLCSFFCDLCFWSEDDNFS